MTRDKIVEKYVKLGLGSKGETEGISDDELQFRIGEFEEKDAKAKLKADNAKREAEIKKVRGKDAKNLQKSKKDLGKAPVFDYDTYFDEVAIPLDNNDPRTGIKNKDVFKPHYAAKNMVVMRGKIRAAKAFNVTVEHLKKAYITLNGKKVDEIYANDIINRYGFSDGIAYNRIQIAEKFKKSKLQVEIAEQKLIEMVQTEDVLAAWANYMASIKAELDRAYDEKAVLG